MYRAIIIFTMEEYLSARERLMMYNNILLGIIGKILSTTGNTLEHDEYVSSAA